MIFFAARVFKFPGAGGFYFKCDHLIKVNILVSIDYVGVRLCSSLVMRYEIIGAICSTPVFAQLEQLCGTNGSGRTGILRQVSFFVVLCGHCSCEALLAAPGEMVCQGASEREAEFCEARKVLEWSGAPS